MGFDPEKEAENYRMTFDYHTHTTYSRGFLSPHGKGTVEENVQAAIDAGLKEVAISDHGPGHLFYGIRPEKIDDLRWDVMIAQKQHPEIKVLMSVEANITESENFLDVPEDDHVKFDFLIAGYHYGVKNCNARKNWFAAHKKYQEGGDNGLVDEAGTPMQTAPKYEKLRETNTLLYLSALAKNDIRILTHPGDKGPVDIAEIAKSCARNDTWMEISTWHDHLTMNEIRIAMREDVKFVISSDAHTPDRVGTFKPGLARALEAGLDPERIVNIEHL